MKETIAHGNKNLKITYKKNRKRAYRKNVKKKRPDAGSGLWAGENALDIDH